MPVITADRPHKHERLVRILDELDAESILLTRPENLAWYFDGARTQVPIGGAPVCSALVHRDGSAVITAPENEVDRLAAEEVAGAEFRRVPWYESFAEAPRGVPTDADAVSALRAARAALLPVERERYAELGRDAAIAVTEVLREARPTMTEFGLAADLAKAVHGIGATPAVVLVAGAERGGVQHPIPTAAPLGRRALAVVTAVRHGLHVSFSRWVRFAGTEPSAVETLREVEADVFAATVPGRALSAVVADIATAYERHGLGSPEHPAWLAHHQGGPTGYLGRDPKVNPHSADLVAAGGAFAWNPWVPHAKLEDTVLIDEAGPLILTADPAWPTTTVRGIPRPLTLDLT